MKVMEVILEILGQLDNSFQMIIGDKNFVFRVPSRLKLSKCNSFLNENFNKRFADEINVIKENVARLGRVATLFHHLG
jgi:hypothetical protein